MDKIDNCKYFKTSVTLRKSSYRRFQAALIILRRNGIDWSEHELCRRILGYYLKACSYGPAKAGRARQYNKKGFEYVRRAAYFNQGLYCILWERSTHHGESISLMLDLAIRDHLPSLIEQLLAMNPLVPAETINSAYWRQRNCDRYEKEGVSISGFLTYVSKTHNDGKFGLTWVQEVRLEAASYQPIRVSDPKSPYFHLGLAR